MKQANYIKDSWAISLSSTNQKLYDLPFLLGFYYKLCQVCSGERRSFSSLKTQRVIISLKIFISAGQVVGVIFFNESPSETKPMLNLLYTSRPPSRWLEETEGQSNSTAYAEVLLVRRTLAWITGIILLIGTLLGVRFMSTKAFRPCLGFVHL